MSKDQKQPTNQDILHELKNHVDQSDKVHAEILVAINSFASDVEYELSDIKAELSEIKNKHSLDMLKINMRLNSLPTKDYLDEKIGDLRGDLVVGQKRTNKAVGMVVKSLERKKVFQANEAKSILKLVERQA